jgi:hypothetical protein
MSDEREKVDVEGATEGVADKVDDEDFEGHKLEVEAVDVDSPDVEKVDADTVDVD